ncbi:MAG: hypothetical protein LBS20_08560 [Prevotella sp.]|jgi:hypothetical protein|nr:hypothetical protein [Prevotella sp.]
MKRVSFFKYSLTLVAIFFAIGIFTSCSDEDDDKLKVSVESLSFDSQTLNKTFQVSSNVNWTIVSDQSWCIVTPTSGNGTSEVNVTVTEYDNYKEARKAEILLSATGLAPIVIEVSQIAGIIPGIKEVKFEAQSYTEWTYFSFDKGDFVTVDQEKYADNSNWDLGFLRFNIRTNGGLSGKGQGAVLSTDKKKFEDVATVPSSGFIEDSEIKVMASGGMPPKYVTTPGNSAFKVGDNQGWAWYDNKSAVWSFNNNVFIIRTASGKYAKVIMKTFLDDKDKSGNITFEYIYPFY